MNSLQLLRPAAPLSALGLVFDSATPGVRQRGLVRWGDRLQAQRILRRVF